MRLIALALALAGAIGKRTSMTMVVLYCALLRSMHIAYRTSLPKKPSTHFHLQQHGKAYLPILTSDLRHLGPHELPF